MTFAGVLLMADLLLVAQLSSLRHGKWGWRWLAFVLITAALVASLTRSAWVALLLALALLFLLRAPKFLLVMTPLLLAALLLAPQPVQERAASIFSLRDVSNYDRVCMLEAGFHMVAERPFFGHGPGMLEERYPLYRHPNAPTRKLAHLHNTYLQIAAERGLLSLFAYLWLVTGALVVGYRGLRREMPFAKGRAELWLGALTALVAFSLAGLFEDNWSDTEVQRIALFVIALPYCLRATEERPAADIADPSPVRESA
jgi:O-antigen ligase